MSKVKNNEGCCPNDIGSIMSEKILFGYEKLCHLIFEEMYNGIKEDDCLILIPNHVIDYLKHNLSHFYSNINFRKQVGKTEELRIYGIKVINGYEENKMVFYHKDFPLMKIKPVVIEIEPDYKY